MATPHPFVKRTPVFTSTATALVAAVLLVGGEAHSAELRVPADFATIQAAIAAAVPGDTVLVAPGLYDENLDFLGKNVNVESEAGPETTIIDGGRRGPVVRFANGENPLARIKGFTLRNGTLGVQAVRSSPTVRENVIADNTGAGVLADNGRPIIELSWIGANLDTGVVMIRAGALVRDNVIENNVGNSGGGIRVVGSSSPRIERNLVVGNRSNTGGGIDLVDAERPMVKNNQILNNSSGLGGGIRIRGETDGTLVGNVIADNTSTGGGGGVAWLVPFTRRGPLLVNNTIAGNVATPGSAILGDGSDARVELVNNLVVASPGGDALVCFSRTPILRNNDVYSEGGMAYVGCADPTGSAGNLSVDPLFADPATGDYRLTAASPVLDLGDDAAPELPPVDFEGEARIVDGDGDGVNRVDIGADELAPVLLTLDPRVSFAGLDVDLTLDASVLRPSGEPVSGTSVSFEVVSGPNAGRTGVCAPGDCATDAQGAVSFSYAGIGGVGVDEIVASIAGTSSEVGPVLAFWDVDCDENAVPDTCDLGCDGFGGKCGAILECGTGADADGDGRLDACNDAPIADAGPDLSVECSSASGAVVMLDGTGSWDPDGDALSYRWTGPGVDVSGPTPTVKLPIGTTVIDLGVDDGRGGTDSDSVGVDVRDGTPPLVEASLEGGRWFGRVFRVQFACSDSCDAAPVATATFGGRAVQNGALVWRGRRNASSSLDVTCSDTAGNASQTSVAAPALPGSRGGSTGGGHGGVDSDDDDDNHRHKRWKRWKRRHHSDDDDDDRRHRWHKRHDDDDD